jgi:hypothetical protein
MTNLIIVQAQTEIIDIIECTESAVDATKLIMVLTHFNNVNPAEFNNA